LPAEHHRIRVLLVQLVDGSGEAVIGVLALRRN
jgi:hypothetical protein